MPGDDDRTRLWRPGGDSEPDTGMTDVDVGGVGALRTRVALVVAEPDDEHARVRLRALAADLGAWEALAGMLVEAARTTSQPAAAIALYEELADVHENLDQPLDVIAAVERLVELDPGQLLHHDRLARLYDRAGAWGKAAAAFERVAELARDDRGRAALRAAGRLYRDHGQHDRAAATYRAILARRPNDGEAARALDDVLTELGRWRELAELRGELAATTDSQLDRAALLRAQARALEHAGDPEAAAALRSASAQLAPEEVSGLIDYADILADGGRGREAADLLATRIADAIGIGAPTRDVAALRLRLAAILDDAGDRAGSDDAIDKLLAAVPDYLPGLEWLASRAARGGDPAAHAAALVRYAGALADPPTRAAVLVEAGRRYREARDPDAALRAFAAAVELAPDDAAAAQELGADRAAADVDRAIAEARALADRGDREAAAARLRAILAAAPAALARERRAVVTHHYAIEVAALGGADAAHQLLHEAHRLDRKNLTITLALGDSCFARKLWREASLQLGSLADHPDAPAHAAAVAAALVRAAAADVRALRPGNVEQRLAAAVRLDPTCAPAWHGLAEIATERGDMEGAATYLDREAAATTDPRDRLRLYEALGDLAHDVLGDVDRAERCWSQVVELGHAPVLDKLLAVQRKRGAGVERGATCERLAELRDDPRERKQLREEAAEMYSAGGDHARARAVAERVLAEHPAEVDAVACASAVALAGGDHAAAAEWLGRALTAWDAAGDRGDGDPRRAELWRRLGDARTGRGDAAGARPAYERAVATAPESDAAHAARRALVDLDDATGDAPAASLAALVEVEQAPADVLAWARACARTADPAARPLFELARALGAALTAADDQFLAHNPTRVLASDETYPAPLATADRRAAVDDADDDGPLGDVLELLWKAAPLIYPNAVTTLARAGVTGAERMVSMSNAAVAALYPQVAKALDGPATLLYAVSDPAAPDLAVLAASPPLVVVGPRLASARARSHADTEHRDDAAVRFRLGRVVELVRERRIAAAAAGPAGFARLVDAIWAAFAKDDAAPADAAVAAEAERLRTAVPLLQRRALADLLATIGRTMLDPARYLAACERAADRSGLLACGDVGVAIELAGGPAAARHLIPLAASPRYHAIRTAWWAPTTDNPRR